MRQRSRTFTPVAVIGMTVVLVVLLAALPAHSQAPTLGEQLAAQYKLAKMGSDSTGTSVVEEGTPGCAKRWNCWHAIQERHDTNGDLSGWHRSCIGHRT